MRKLTKNIFVAVFTKLLLIIFSIVAQRFVLRSYGSEINGLTSSITQFLSYFTLLEAGLGLASIQALYKPLATGDQSGIDGILSATSRQYRKIGLIFLGLSIILSITMPLISHSELDKGLVFFITILMGMSMVANYLFIGRYQVLLSADRKVYVINILDAVLGVSFSLIKILLINAGYSIIVVLSAALLSPVIRTLVLFIYVKISYPKISYKVVPNYEAIGKRKYVLVQQIVGMITNHTDVTILTVFSTLSQVSVYSVYNLIYGNISAIISTAFSSAAQASFGRMVESEIPELNRYYELYELFFTCMLFCLMAAVLVMTIPFVSLYTEGVIGVEYIDPILAILFMVSMLFSTIRIPAITMVNASGRFKETQKGAVIEAIINIAVSIPAFLFLGVRGLLIGTCVAMGYRALDIQIYTYRKVLGKSLKRWIFMVCLNIFLMVIFVLFFTKVDPIIAENWISWLLAGIKCMAIAVLWFGVVCGVLYRKSFLEVYKLIRKKY